jgi:predicted FMN-binding regulatory protein PaiB
MKKAGNSLELFLDPLYRSYMPFNFLSIGETSVHATVRAKPLIIKITNVGGGLFSSNLSYMLWPQ